MKFWKVSVCVAFVALTTGLLACTKSVNGDNSCLSYAYAPITEAVIPDTAKINENVPFRIKFNLVNSCGSYYTTDNGAVGDTLTIAIIAQYRGCDTCVAFPRNIDSTIAFKSSIAKKYYLKFLGQNNTFTRDSIVFQ